MYWVKATMHALPQQPASLNRALTHLMQIQSVSFDQSPVLHRCFNREAGWATS